MTKEQLEKQFDIGYLTGVQDAMSFAIKIGFKDCAVKIAEEVNRRSKNSGLPGVRIPK